MSYTTTIPAVSAVPERKIEHAYCIGQTIEKTGVTVGAVAFGNPSGLYSGLPCYHYIDEGVVFQRWDFVSVIDDRYPKPAPKPASKPVTTTTIVIEQYFFGDPCYGATAKYAQDAVLKTFKNRTRDGERWVVTTTVDGAEDRSAVEPACYPELDSDTV